jgi:hypothetical protein
MSLADIAIGLSALIAACILSLFTGGFSFFTPWLVWVVILFFVAGFSRPPSQQEAVWRRVISIDLCWLIVLPAVLRGIWWGVVLAEVGIFVPTTAGVVARRLLCSRRQQN